MRDTWTLPGELNKLTSGEAEMEASLEDSVPLADEIPFDTGAIDFELDLGDESPPAAPDLSATTPGIGREFDLSFDGDEVEPTAPADAGELVFDLDIGEPDAADDSPAVPMPTISSLDFELPEMDFGSDGNRFDLDATVVSSSGTIDDEQLAAAAVPAAASEAVVDLERTAFDTSLLDFDFELDAPSAPSSAPVPAGLDLTSIDLDLDPRAAPEAGFDAVPFSVAETQFDQPAETASGGEDGVGNEEAETKLELARAYEEMGDKEGALELLQEVLAEGTARQQTTARDIIVRLG